MKIDYCRVCDAVPLLFLLMQENGESLLEVFTQQEH